MISCDSAGIWALSYAPGDLHHSLFSSKTWMICGWSASTGAAKRRKVLHHGIMAPGGANRDMPQLGQYISTTNNLRKNRKAIHHNSPFIELGFTCAIFLTLFGGYTIAAILPLHFHSSFPRFPSRAWQMPNAALSVSAPSTCPLGGAPGDLGWVSHSWHV